MPERNVPNPGGCPKVRLPSWSRQPSWRSTSVLSGEEFGRLFETFEQTAFRLETLSVYDAKETTCRQR
ncbi:hypothetical protein GCM10017778_16090 [Streptomyces vinaceus]|nr:hypothetical protein GCM10017778_16090 [Streptomyces vinaceus]